MTNYEMLCQFSLNGSKMLTPTGALTTALPPDWNKDMEKKFRKFLGEHGLKMTKPFKGSTTITFVSNEECV